MAGLAPSPSGKAEVCKTSITSSNLVGASNFSTSQPFFRAGFFSWSSMSLFAPHVLLLFVMVGGAAGFIAGLMGIGGGIIMIPLFLWAFQVAGMAPEIIVHSAFGTSLAIIIPTAFSSAVAHRRHGNVDWHQVLRMACGSLLGVAIGSSLAAGLSGAALKACFGVMQIGVGSHMLLRRHAPVAADQVPHPLPRLLFIGFIVGAFASFFGVGGGIIAVPLMVLLLGQTMHRAVGTSSGLMIFSAVFGTVSYVWHGWNHPLLPPYALGYVNLLVAAIMIPTTILFARQGVRVASRTPHDKLVKIFALFIITVGVWNVVKLFLP